MQNNSPIVHGKKHENVDLKHFNTYYISFPLDLILLTADSFLDFQSHVFGAFHTHGWQSLQAWGASTVQGLQNKHHIECPLRIIRPLADRTRDMRKQHYSQIFQCYNTRHSCKWDKWLKISNKVMDWCILNSNSIWQ